MNVAPVAETARAEPPAISTRVVRPTAPAVVLICLTLLGIALRFWRIGHQSYWYDESVTLTLVHHSLGKMLSLLPSSEGTPPLYYCLAWIWVRIFGFGEAGLRSLSAVAGVAVIPLMYLIGEKLISRRVGLVAAALTAFNPFLIWYSQEARSYSLLVLLSTVSLLAFVHLLTPRPSRRWLAAWALASALTLTTHYYGVLAVVPQAGWLLWIHRRAAAAWLAVVVVGAAGCAVVPLAISQKSNTAWIATAPLDLRLRQIAPQFLLGTGAPARDWLKLAGAVALLVALVLLVVRADGRERRGALVAGALALAGFLLSLVLIAAGVDELITRNLMVVLIALIVLCAAGLGVRRGGLLGLGGAVTLCVIGLIATIAVAVNWKFQRAPWREVARVVASARPPGAAGAILVENDESRLPLGDYIARLYPVRLAASVREFDVVAAVKGPSDVFCWWGSACAVPLAPLDTTIQLRGFQPTGRVLHVGQFSIYRLRAPAPVRITREEVARAFAGTSLRSYALLLEPAA